MRLVLAIIFIVIGLSAQAQQFHIADGSTTVFRALDTGAGGQITNIDIAADGTKVIRTDAFGGYYYNPTVSPCGNANRVGCWQQLVTAQSMPSASQTALNAAGVVEVRIAPSNTKHFYMYYGGDGCLYSSLDRGSTWAKTAFSCVAFGANLNTKFFGPFIAIDPANENIVYVSTPTELFVATDGTTFSQVLGLTNAADPSGIAQGGGFLTAFDPSSSVVGNVTQGIYTCSYGTGCYHSTNGGSSWTLTTSTPTTQVHLFIDAAGNVFLTTFASGGTPPVGPLYECTTGCSGWTQILNQSITSVAINPTTSGGSEEIVAGANGGRYWISLNGGSSFTEALSPTRAATDIPWLAWTNEAFMTNGNMVFDASGLLWFAEGIGVWTNTPPVTNISTTAPVFTSVSAAIEELVNNWIVSPWGSGSNPIFTYWDRPEFVSSNPSVYPSVHGVANAQTNSIVMGWSADWATSSPCVIAVVASNTGNTSNESGLSSDCGQTWSQFGSLPYSGTGTGSRFSGSIAASTPQNLMWVVSNNGGPFCSNDAGTTWQAQTIDGIATTDTGWNSAYFYKRQTVAADRSVANTFYVFNDGSGSSANAGIYKTSDACTTWTQVYSGNLPSHLYTAFNARLRTVPGVANDLFFTAGVQGSAGRSNSPTAGVFFYECTGATTLTCSAVSNVLEVWAFGFGAPKPGGGGFPAVFIYGWVNNQGPYVWRSDDHCVTWVQASLQFPTNMDEVVTVEGDAHVWGRVYIGMAGSGAAYGSLQ